jgi:N-acetylglucosamine kinase-like BadF-type ATPase
MNRLFLGVDGGQSSTTALIADESGRILGSGRGGPCNHVGAAEGRAKFTGAITGCLAAACAEAGLDPAQVRFEAACLGFSGGPEDKEPVLRRILRAERLLVTHDALIALSGATAGEPGIITIAGTGSIAFGRDRRGRTARAGGWGYIFGDEGGAFDLARQALRAILRQEEGWGPRTALTAKLLEATGARRANELLHRFYTTEFPRPRIASLARLVDECARAGDHVAHRLLENAARDLAALASAVHQQLFTAGEPAAVAYVGGVFRCAVLLERFRLLVELTEGCRVAAPLHSPAAGALIDALASAGLKPKLSGLPRQEK